MSGQISKALQELDEEIEVLERILVSRRQVRDSFAGLWHVVHKDDEVSV